MKNFILLLQFFTRLPINKKIEYNHKEYGEKTYLLPLVGLIIGILFFGLGKILMFLQMPKEIYGLILLMFWIFITGALHLDGFADTIDGLFSYRNKEKILEIMRDPHIGVNGVIGLILIILTKFLFYINIPLEILALSFVVGRLGVVLSASMGTYARDKGMAIAIIQFNDKKSFIKSFFLVFIIFIFFRQYILYLFLSLIFVYFIHRWITKKIDGITGDTLGFVCELTEILFLFLFFLGGKIELFGLH